MFYRSTNRIGLGTYVFICNPVRYQEITKSAQDRYFLLSIGTKTDFKKYFVARSLLAVEKRKHVVFLVPTW